MEEVKAFLGRAGKAAVNIFEAFKRLPIVKPLFGLLSSRKALIASGLTGFMLEAFPKLVPVKSELDVVTAQVVVIGLAWLATSLGIAYEDGQEKQGAFAAGATADATVDAAKVEAKSAEAVADAG